MHKSLKPMLPACRFTDAAHMHFINVTHLPVDVNFTNSDPDDPPSGACTINGYNYRCVALIFFVPLKWPEGPTGSLTAIHVWQEADKGLLRQLCIKCKSIRHVFISSLDVDPSQPPIKSALHLQNRCRFSFLDKKLDS